MPGELSKSDYKPFLSIKVGKLRVKANNYNPLTDKIERAENEFTLYRKITSIIIN